MGKFRLGELLTLASAMATLCLFPSAVSPANGAREDLMVMENAAGKTGGRLVVALRSEPKTLNPVLAIDDPSRDVIRCLSGDLIHINRETLKTGPALAKSWNVSPDGRMYTLHLRQGFRTEKRFQRMTSFLLFRCISTKTPIRRSAICLWSAGNQSK
jgi:ABC-type transport system substrate-binding protein